MSLDNTQTLNHLASQVMLLARFLCFMAVFYLALHNIIARLSRNPGGKILWFFDVLTGPLTRPVRAWAMNDLTNQQVLARSLLLYLCLWLCLIALGRLAAMQT